MNWWDRSGTPCNQMTVPPPAQKRDAGGPDQAAPFLPRAAATWASPGAARARVPGSSPQPVLALQPCGWMGVLWAPSLCCAPHDREGEHTQGPPTRSWEEGPSQRLRREGSGRVGGPPAPLEPQHQGAWTPGPSSQASLPGPWLQTNTGHCPGSSSRNRAKG